MVSSFSPLQICLQKLSPYVRISDSDKTRLLVNFRKCRLEQFTELWSQVQWTNQGLPVQQWLPQWLPLSKLWLQWKSKWPIWFCITLSSTISDHCSLRFSSLSWSAHVRIRHGPKLCLNIIPGVVLAIYPVCAQICLFRFFKCSNELASNSVDT